MNYIFINIIFLFLLISNLIFGNIQQDSLEKRLNIVTGTEKINVLNKLSVLYLNDLPDRSVYLGNRALELSLELNDSVGKAQAYNNIGEGYRYQGDNLKALEYFRKSLMINEEIRNDIGTATSLNNIGRIYRFIGIYDNSLEYHLRSLEINTKINNKKGIASSLINTGVVYRNLGNNEEALKNYYKALEISKEINDKSQISNSLISIGNIFWYLNQNKKALSFYLEALDVSKTEGFKGDNPAGIFNNIGNAYRNMSKYDKALHYYQISLKISRNSGDKNLIAVTLKNIGITYKKSGNYYKALKYFYDSKKLAQEINLLRIVNEDLLHLSEIYAYKADNKKALEYYKEYSALKDTIFNRDKSNKIAMLQIQYRVKENEKEKEILQKNIDIQKLNLSKEQNLRNYFIFITILIIILAVVIYNRYRIKIKTNCKLKQLNAELEKRVSDRTHKLKEENIKRKEAQEQAEIANEYKNKFLSSISHEIRTPLNAITTLTKLTLETNLNSEQQENLKKVKDSSDHLLSLIKDIIDFSQIETGKIELEHEKFDMFSILESIINAQKNEAKIKNISLSLNCNRNIPQYLIGDSGRLRQILYNLIGNATKFTEKGQVSVSVNIKEKINENDDKIKLLFSVKDTGIGISELKQKMIFQDFTQADSSPRRKYGGAGLGLTISKYFVELMGGEIWIESEISKGSIFYFTIQLQIDKEKKNINYKTQKKKTNKSLKILIAEDNILNAHVAILILKKLGHSTKTAINGKEAVDYLTKEPFDLVLMDIEMPEMDGIEATKIIRAGNENVLNPNIPIIALTAHALKDYEIRSMEAGMNYYLTKPPNIAKLSEVINSFA
ncbi:MAG: tetratricopeptide repeat protein [Bacteroidales bacterium]|nr:tetratricopeptide repeat protein [Bacteroidales bacterium]